MKQQIFLSSPKQVTYGLLALRVAFGCFMMVHGLQKVMGFSTISEGAVGLVASDFIGFQTVWFVD